jgi:hypothetical protein
MDLSTHYRSLYCSTHNVLYVFNRRFLVTAHQFLTAETPTLSLSGCRTLLTATSRVQSQSRCSVTTDGESASLSSCQAHSGNQNQIFITVSNCALVYLGLPLWREDGSVLCNCYLSAPVERGIVVCCISLQARRSRVRF